MKPLHCIAIDLRWAQSITSFEHRTRVHVHFTHVMLNISVKRH